MGIAALYPSYEGVNLFCSERQADMILWGY
jgi:hypothetical protein